MHPSNQKYTRDRGPRDKLDRSDRGAERTRDGKMGMNGARRGLKEDSDGWTSVKPRKSFGQEDEEKSGRRNGERESREVPPRAMGSFEHHNRDRDREREGDRDPHPRRNGMGRARNELSWLKDRDQQTPKDEPSSRDAPRAREWREKDSGSDRDWSRPATQGEKDPEWMDTPAPEEKTAHTQEDFQRWKEKMKAGSGPSESKSLPAEATEVGQRTASGTLKAQKTGTPLFMDKSEDKFFEMWNQPKPSAEVSTAPAAADAPPKPVSKSAQGKASRFTSFFAPQEESPPQAPPSHYTPAEVEKLQSSNPEDQEGFQRILQMLGGASLIPQQPPSYQQSQTAERRRPQSPINETLHTDPRSHMSNHQNKPSDDPRSRFPQFSPNNPPKTKDMEFLQGLMQQIPSHHLPHQHHNPLGAEFYGAYSGNRGPPPRRPSPPAPPQSQTHSQSQTPYPDFHQRRPDQGPAANQPTILRRPPGLDQATPPGWPNPNAQQKPPSSHTHAQNIAPPPGLSSLPQQAQSMGTASSAHPNPNSNSNPNPNNGNLTNPNLNSNSSNRSMPPFPAFPVPPPGMFPSHQDLANLPPPPPGFYMNGMPPPPPLPPGYPPHLLGFPPGMMGPGGPGVPGGPAGPPRQGGQGQGQGQGQALTGFDMFGPSSSAAGAGGGIEAGSQGKPGQSQSQGQQGQSGRGPPPGKLFSDLFFPLNTAHFSSPFS